MERLEAFRGGVAHIAAECGGIFEQVRCTPTVSRPAGPGEVAVYTHYNQDLVAPQMTRRISALSREYAKIQAGSGFLKSVCPQRSTHSILYVVRMATLMPLFADNDELTSWTYWFYNLVPREAFAAGMTHHDFVEIARPSQFESYARWAGQRVRTSDETCRKMIPTSMARAHRREGTVSRIRYCLSTGCSYFTPEKGLRMKCGVLSGTVHIPGIWVGVLLDGYASEYTYFRVDNDDASALKLTAEH